MYLPALMCVAPKPISVFLYKLSVRLSMNKETEMAFTRMEILLFINNQ